MEENQTVVNSNDNGTTQETEQNSGAGQGEQGTPNPTTTPTQPVQFNSEQQAKVNSLLKEEKSKIYSRYGVSKAEELDELVKAGKEYNANKDNYSSMQNENLSLRAENALIKNKVREDMTEVVQNYFKGAGLELNAKNLEQLFNDKPALKEQWTEKVNKEPVVIGNSPSSNGQSTNSEKAEYEAIKRKVGINY